MPRYRGYAQEAQGLGHSDAPAAINGDGCAPSPPSSKIDRHDGLAIYVVVLPAPITIFQSSTVKQHGTFVTGRAIQAITEEPGLEATITTCCVSLLKDYLASVSVKPYQWVSFPNGMPTCPMSRRRPEIAVRESAPWCRPSTSPTTNAQRS